MSDLVAWLREQLDADERVARAVAQKHWEHDQGEVVAPCPNDVLPDKIADGVLYGDMHEPMSEETARHIAHWDPQRVLSEVEAKRTIIDLHQPRTVTVADYEQHMDGVVICSMCSYPHGTSVGADEYRPWPCSTVRTLLLPYRDRPGYDPAWGGREHQG